jgi:hypothetical protein
MPDDDFNPIEAMRAQAAATADIRPDAPEYGLDTPSVPVTNKDVAPLAVRLRGPTLRPAVSAQAVLADILMLEANLPTAEWRHFRMAAGRALGFVAHRGDQDDLE